jgi:hypothetical protein
VRAALQRVHDLLHHLTFVGTAALFFLDSAFMIDRPM